MSTKMFWLLCAVTWMLVVVRINAGGGNVRRSTTQACPVECSCLGNTVDCSKKTRRSVPEGLPGWVEVLDLSGNEIESLDTDSFLGLDRLLEINLSNNKLMFVNLTSMHLLEKLSTVKLGYNRLTELPLALATCNLTNLILSHNEIRAVDPTVLMTLPNLQVLDLSYNQLTHLVNGTFPFLPNLHQLFLNNNELVSIERGAFDSLLSLEWLKLSKNRIKTLHKNVFAQLNNLKYLELERNRVHTVPGLVFLGLHGIVSLKLKRNSVTDLMDGALWGLNKIQILDLGNNNISTVNKKWLYGLETLQQLSLAHNRLHTVEVDSWRYCLRLWELDLRHNRLELLTEKMFENLDSLRHLLLSHNRLTFISDTAFYGLSGLQVLDLAHNELSWTLEDASAAFDPLLSLARLALQHNRLRALQRRVFQGLGTLRQLHLEGNDVGAAQPGTFDAMKDLRDFRFNSSRLVCDCLLSWLPGWVREAGFQATVEARCTYPPSANGLSVFDVDSKEFQCDAVSDPRPVMTLEPRSQLALLRSNISLSCEAASSSAFPPTIEWKKDNKVLEGAIAETVLRPGAQAGRVRVSSTLRVHAVHDSHAGRYQCVASNELATAYSTRALISVNVYPTFVKTPQDVVVRAGTIARLDCAAAGLPTPEIALQKDGGDDFPAARERRMHIFPSDEVFFIVGVKAEDEGVYTCIAKNDVGVITANATVQVLESPTFARRMENKATVEGDTTVLECMTAGNPRPRLQWIKDGAPLAPTLRHFFTADDQLLVIVETRAEDAGAYTCVMTNALGSERQTSRVSVTGGAAGGGAAGGATEGAGGDPGGAGTAATTTGVVVIAVVCCVVGTSLVWVIVIYRTRRRGKGRKGWLCQGGGAAGGGGEGEGGREACYRSGEAVGGNSSAQRLLCATQTPAFACVDAAGGARGCTGAAAHHKLQTAARFMRDMDGDDGPRRHSYCLSGHCHTDELPAERHASRHRSDSGTHTASSSLSCSTSADTSNVSATSTFHAFLHTLPCAAAAAPPEAPHAAGGPHGDDSELTQVRAALAQSLAAERRSVVASARTDGYIDDQRIDDQSKDPTTCEFRISTPSIDAVPSTEHGSCSSSQVSSSLAESPTRDSGAAVKLDSDKLAAAAAAALEADGSKLLHDSVCTSLGDNISPDIRTSFNCVPSVQTLSSIAASSHAQQNLRSSGAFLSDSLMIDSVIRSPNKAKHVDVV